MCVRRVSLVFGIIVSSLFSTAIAFGQNLEIHYINVGWVDSVFVKGPDGTTVLLEAGNTGMGTSRVVPYLQSIGIQPANGLDYMIGGHQHCDHIGGLDEVINAGYDVRIQSYYNGSSYQSSCVQVGMPRQQGPRRTSSANGRQPNPAWKWRATGFRSRERQHCRRRHGFRL